MLAVFYHVIEVWKWEKWALPFVWIGMNPITIYLAHNLVDFSAIAQRFVGGDLNHVFGKYGPMVVACMVSFLTFAFCRFLYQRKIFLRV